MNQLDLASREGLIQLLKGWQEVLKVDLIEFLGVTEQTEFFAETVFLQHWCQNPHGLYDDDLEELDVSFQPVDSEEPAGRKLLQLYFKLKPSTVDDEGELREVYLRLDPGPERSGSYALQIIHDDCPVYERTAQQDEHTEWIFNEMANDLTDKNGKFFFEGESTTI